MYKKITGLILLMIFFFQPAKAQTVQNVGNTSFKAEIGLPNGVTNYAFRYLLQGLVIATPSFQKTFDNTFSVGLGLRYGYFNVNEFKNNVGMTGGIHTVGAFGKIGQEKFYGDFGIDYGVRVGYMTNFFTTNKNKQLLGKAYHNDGGFVEPMLDLILKVDDNNAYHLALSYTFQTYQFLPHQMGLDVFSGINADRLNEVTSFFTIGFGYAYYFNRKKQ